jgi:threonine/homoserine/homoserine lactone efflux protein
LPEERLPAANATLLSFARKVARKRRMGFGFGFIAITTIVNAAVILVAGRFVAAARPNPRALRPFDYGFAALMSAFALRLAWSETRQ